MTEISTRMFMMNQLKLDKSVPEVIAVTSGKGGVGKTFLSVNLAIHLVQLKQRVLLLDADIHLGNIDLFLGLRPQYTIADVIHGEKEISEIVIKGPNDVDILPASSCVKDLIQQEKETLNKFRQAFKRFEHNYDKIIVDTGAGISSNVLSFLLGADKIIVIVTPDPASIADAYGVMKIVAHFAEHIPILLVANIVRDEEEGRSLFNKMNLMTERFLQRSIMYGGSIVETVSIAHSVKRQKPMMIHQPNAVPMSALRNIARKLFRVPVPDRYSRSGLFEQIIDLREISLGAEDE